MSGRAPGAACGGDYLFVYGTLMRGYELHGWLRSARFVGRGWVAGRLVRVADYPGLVREPRTSGRVRGEVYRLARPERDLEVLDRVEGASPADPAPEFRRERLEAVLEDTGGRVEAWGYVYAGSTEGVELIPSGDFRSCRPPRRRPG